MKLWDTNPLRQWQAVRIVDDNNRRKLNNITDVCDS